MAASASIHRGSIPPSTIFTRADFEHQYRQFMDVTNRYCRYGDIELYAPSEDGAATLLKAVAEPLVRMQRWMRLGSGIDHMMLYELLKVFAALGGDRELVLAAADELDSAIKHSRTATQSVSFHRSNGASDGRARPESNGHGNGNGNGHNHGIGNPHSNGHSENGVVLNDNGLGDNKTPPQRHLRTGPPGFLLLRTDPRVRDTALRAESAASAISAGVCQPVLVVESYDGGSAFGGGGSAGVRKQQHSRGASGLGPVEDASLSSTVAAESVTAAKYRLWSRMMEAALQAKAVEEQAAAPAVAVAADANQGGGGGGSGAGGNRMWRSGGGRGQQSSPSGVPSGGPPTVVWGLLTDTRSWRFYCVREVRHGHVQPHLHLPHHPFNGHPHARFEILGSRRLCVADEAMTSWYGLVPAVTALYGILCTAEGLAVRRPDDSSSYALTYDMPHDPYRDRLMRFHLIMGAANGTLYGSVGEWVRQRLDEYVQCRRQQKRLREAATAAAAAAIAAAAASATSEPVPSASDDSVAPSTLMSSSPSPFAAAAAAATPAEADEDPNGIESSLSSGEWEPPVSRILAASTTAAAAVADSGEHRQDNGTDVTPGGPLPAAEPSYPLGPPGLAALQEQEEVDEEGVGGLGEAVTHAGEVTAYFESRLADARQQLQLARQRAARLRARALLAGRDIAAVAAAAGVDVGDGNSSDVGTVARSNVVPFVTRGSDSRSATGPTAVTSRLSGEACGPGGCRGVVEW